LCFQAALVEGLKVATQTGAADAATAKELVHVREERDDAQGQLSSMMELVRKLSSNQSSSTYRSSVYDVFKLPTGDRAAALKRLTWDDLDAEVARQNADLGNRMSPIPDGNNDGEVAGPGAQLSDLRVRLQTKLRKLVQDSNSIRIRSAALSPSKSASAVMVGRGGE
jgi:hypothetical protein